MKSTIRVMEGQTVKIDISSFLRHAFTFSAKQRAAAAKIPGIGPLIEGAKHLATGAAVSVLAEHIDNPIELAVIAQKIGDAVDRAVPTPVSAVKTATDVAKHVTDTSQTGS